MSTISEVAEEGQRFYVLEQLGRIRQPAQHCPGGNER